MPASLCVFPIFNFAFTLPALPSIELPFLNLNFNIDLFCPLD